MTAGTLLQPAPPEHFFELRLGEADDKLGQLHAFGTYWTWAQSYDPSAPPLRLMEWTRAGVADVTTDHYSMHVAHAGTPHRIEGLFGYWLTSDGDHIWIQAPRQDRRYYTLIAGGKTGVNRSHSLTWYCEECGTQLGEPRPIPHDGSPASFLAAQQRAVDAFNADPAARRCPSCSAVHPLTYGWQAQGAGVVPVAVEPGPAAAPTTADEKRVVARLSELEDGIATLVAWRDRQVALIRVGEKVFAIDNTCPHRGGPLGLGEVRNGAVTCPWHRFRFDLETGRSVTNPELCAVTYDVEIRGEEIVIVERVATKRGVAA